jgi:hypothetical protein
MIGDNLEPSTSSGTFNNFELKVGSTCLSGFRNCSLCPHVESELRHGARRELSLECGTHIYARPIIPMSSRKFIHATRHQSRSLLHGG